MNVLRNVWLLYYEGFKNMRVGKKLWFIIGIKLFVMFAILKIFFFPNALELQQDNNKTKSDVVLENFINAK